MIIIFNTKYGSVKTENNSHVPMVNEHVVIDQLVSCPGFMKQATNRYIVEDVSHIYKTVLGQTVLDKVLVNLKFIENDLSE